MWCSLYATCHHGQRTVCLSRKPTASKSEIRKRVHLNCPVITGKQRFHKSQELYQGEVSGQPGVRRSPRLPSLPDTGHFRFAVHGFQRYGGSPGKPGTRGLLRPPDHSGTSVPLFHSQTDPAKGEKENQRVLWPVHVLFSVRVHLLLWWGLM